MLNTSSSRIDFEVGKKYYFGTMGFFVGSNWNYGDYGFYTVIDRSAKFVTVRSSYQHCINEDTQEMAYEVFRIKIHIDKKGAQEMALIRGKGIYANNIHEDSTTNNDVSRW